MAFWGNQRWTKEAANLLAHANFEIVSGFKENFSRKLKDGSYKLSVGSEIILSASDVKQGGAYRKISEDEEIPLRPGQFAYLITEEDVRIPFTALGFINVATKLKLQGLVNISGFHVDPGYRGKLIFTVFNASPSPITLYKGQEMFRLWLSDLDGAGGDSDTKYDKMPKDLAKGMNGSYSSPFALAERISALEKTTESLRIGRLQIGLAIAFVAIFLLPLTAALYANIYSAWLEPAIGTIVNPKQISTED